MTAKLTLVAKSGTVGRSAGGAAVGPLHKCGTAISTIPVALRLLFIGHGKLADWAELHDMIKSTLGDAIEIMTIARLKNLGARGTKRADIVFIQGTRARCTAKTRLRVGEFCPLASTIYLTTAATESDPSRRDDEPIHVTVARPLPPERILVAIFDAMRRRICCLKLALGAPETEMHPGANLVERLFLLTPQETRILGAVRQGIPNKLVAHQLNITVRTVKAHLTEIFRKTGFTQRAELIAKCSELAATCDVIAKDDLADFRRRDACPSPFPFARRATSKQSPGPNGGAAKSASHAQRANPMPPRMSAPTRR